MLRLDSVPSVGLTVDSWIGKRRKVWERSGHHKEVTEKKIFLSAKCKLHFHCISFVLLCKLQLFVLEVEIDITGQVLNLHLSAERYKIAEMNWIVCLQFTLLQYMQTHGIHRSIQIKLSQNFSIAFEEVHLVAQV